MPQHAQASFVAEPPLSEDYPVSSLDTEVRRDLRGLQKETADSVARHLVAAGSLVGEDPQAALAHARYARRRASRIAVVREAAGIAAYHAGEWAEALAELRAARRMGGGPLHLPVMADIERALGRPERAVDIARGPEAAELGTAERIELAIVGAGARRDLGELDASVVALQVPELEATRREPWSARLFYAYADNLLAAGREADALEWFGHAVDADTEGETDATARLAVLTGADPEDDADDFEFGEEELAALVQAPDAADDRTEGGEPQPPRIDEAPAGESDESDADVADDAGDGEVAESMPADATGSSEPAADAETVDADDPAEAADRPDDADPTDVDADEVSVPVTTEDQVADSDGEAEDGDVEDGDVEDGGSAPDESR